MVAAIVILGIVAVAAWKYTVDFRLQAHDAFVRDTFAKFRAGLEVARSACLVKGGGGPSGTVNLAGFRDGTVDFNANCDPVGTANTDPTNAQLNAPRCAEIWRAVLGPSPRVPDGSEPFPYWSLEHFEFRAEAFYDGCHYYSNRETRPAGNLAALGYYPFGCCGNTNKWTYVVPVFGNQITITNW